jgi:RNA polymerase sigma-70 factor (ECF subfamily)
MPGLPPRESTGPRGHPLSNVKRTDEELMRSYQDGDQAAFEDLYRRYRNAIYGFLARRYTSTDNAGELTQEVFLRVIRSRDSFRHGSRFATWIFTIARNLAVDNARKAGHRRHASLDQGYGDSGKNLHERVPNGGAKPDQGSERTRLRADLIQAIDKLPDEQREVFLLREFHGLPFKEVAEIVDAKEGTVKSRMRYALETLRDELSQHMDYARTLP